MNQHLRELYQSVIVDHGKNPRNFRTMDNPTHTLEGFNPLCGDQLTLYLVVDNNVVTDVSFTGSGCAISMASASLMTEALVGKTLPEARTLFEAFHAMITSSTEPSDALKKLAILAGVKEFPARVKCATLAWHTFIGSVDGQTTAAKTE